MGPQFNIAEGFKNPRAAIPILYVGLHKDAQTRPTNRLALTTDTVLTGRGEGLS